MTIRGFLCTHRKVISNLITYKSVFFFEVHISFNEILTAALSTSNVSLILQIAGQTILIQQGWLNYDCRLITEVFKATNLRSDALTMRYNSGESCLDLIIKMVKQRCMCLPPMQRYFADECVCTRLVQCPLPPPPTPIPPINLCDSGRSPWKRLRCRQNAKPFFCTL